MQTFTQKEYYRLLSKIGEGGFSEVFVAESLKTGKHVAIKCMKARYKNVQKVKKLKEIQALSILSSQQNIIKLIQALYDQPTGKLALIFQLMEQSLYDRLVKKKDLSMEKIKHYMYLLLKAIALIHKNGIFHRDIRPENVLISGDTIKLAGFNLCKGIFCKKQPYTEYIGTRWYRSLQCLMTDGYYDEKMDIWSYGCVLFQMISRHPLFNGNSQIDQIHRINKILGSPNPQLLERFKKNQSTSIKQNQWNFLQQNGIGLQKLLPTASKQLLDLLSKLLQYDPLKRITAQEALQHQYFKEIANQQSYSNKLKQPIFQPSEAYLQHKQQKYQYMIQCDKSQTKILGAQRLDPLLFIYIPALIITPCYTYYMAVHNHQEKPYPFATVTMTACHYPQDIVFRYVMIICSSILSLTFYIVFRWLENQCKKVQYHHKLSKLWFYVTQFSICCYMIAVGTIDEKGTGPLHSPSAVIFFVIFLIVIIRITIYLNAMRNWDTTVLSARSLLIKNIVASYITAVWLYCLYFVLTLSDDQSNDDSFKYTVIVQWNSVLINLLWLLSFVYEWKQFNFCLTYYSKKQVQEVSYVLKQENIQNLINQKNEMRQNMI